jgi:hypothetical protein
LGRRLRLLSRAEAATRRRLDTHASLEVFMRSTIRFNAALGVLMCGIIAAGCSRMPSAPSPPPAAGSPTWSDAVSQPAAQGASLTIADLEARGWDCQPAPTNPTRQTCSHPNELHPVLLPGPPPPSDRPASITLLVFDNGVFAGTDLLIRSDLYNGQPCQPTGAPYRFIARIGYYECLHQPQGG